MFKKVYNKHNSLICSKTVIVITGFYIKKEIYTEIKYREVQR